MEMHFEDLTELPVCLDVLEGWGHKGGQNDPDELAQCNHFPNTTFPTPTQIQMASTCP